MWSVYVHGLCVSLKGLEVIKKTWEDTYLDVEPYKDAGHFWLR